MRFARKRDENEMSIFDALRVAGCDPWRFDDFDIAARHIDGYGVMIEVKVAKGKLRERQVRLANLFGDRYRIARTPEQGLIACGRLA